MKNLWKFAVSAALVFSTVWAVIVASNAHALVIKQDVLYEEFLFLVAFLWDYVILCLVANRWPYSLVIGD